MSDVYLFLVLSDLGEESAQRAALEKTLGEYGELAPLLPTSWLLSVDADTADEQDLNAGSLVEELLDVLGEEVHLSVVEVDNIATYEVHEESETLLDKLFPQDDDEDEEE